VILGGALIAFVGSLVSSFGYLANGGTTGGTLVTVFGIVGIIMGLIMIIGGFMMYSKPGSAKMWGVIILILSILSWIKTGKASQISQESPKFGESGIC